LPSKKELTTPQALAITNEEMTDLLIWKTNMKVA
jgi:hypothetical protein